MFVLKSLRRKFSSRKERNDVNKIRPAQPVAAAAAPPMQQQQQPTRRRIEKSATVTATAAATRTAAGARDAAVAAAAATVAARANSVAATAVTAAATTRSKSFHGTRPNPADPDCHHCSRRSSNTSSSSSSSSNDDNGNDDDNAALSITNVNDDSLLDVDDCQKNEASEEQGLAAKASTSLTTNVSTSPSSTTTTTTTTSARRNICACSNCRGLAQLVECAVCLECLQGGQIRCCPVCANAVCQGCAGRLKHCAFCRSARPLEPNRALERFVDRLVLPCRNARQGCARDCTGETRRGHEATCRYGQIECPVGRTTVKCGWLGTTREIAEHLDEHHKLRVLEGRAFALEIGQFRAKISHETRGCIYTICLSCHDQLFVIKIHLKRMQLRLSCERLGWTRELDDGLAADESSSPAAYGIAVQTSSSYECRRKVKFFVPMGRYEREVKEFTVDCKKLLRKDHVTEAPPTDDCPCGAGDNHDMVKIQMRVKRLDENEKINDNIFVDHRSAGLVSSVDRLRGR
ncbi:uncharacterized protein LOC106653527 [Trichogramma pretiosum]|uniref:uncharacterized protein LOC106653527 n=1 Tax=Trichogramma pretiosum TaxID=7493 RepID=UPI0006C992FD|nr:uncharacterized protein LOC106653527 [Trichogramma pretiosum]